MNAPVRWSHLKKFALSPAHYASALEDDSHDTLLMRIGRATDAYVFGGTEPVAYEGKRQGKVWDAFLEANLDADIITTTEYDKARPMADAVLSSSVAAPYLVGAVMQELRWKYLGHDAVSHPDLIGDRFVTELKTSNSVAPWRFERHARSMFYPSQLAFYGAAAKALGITDPRRYYIVAVESSKPYPVTVFEVTSRAIVAGQKQCRLWMEQLLSCEATNEFPGYSQSVMPLDIEDDFELTYADDEAELAEV